MESSIPKNLPETKHPKRELFSSSIKQRIMIGALSLMCMVDLGSFKKPQDYSSHKTFNAAFKKAREDAHKLFMWNGKTYTTELVSKEISDTYFESKKFLEDYYNSEYFKSKQVVNPIAVSNDLSRERDKDERLKYLEEKMKSGHATKEEKTEYTSLLMYYFDDQNDKHIAEVERRVRELKSLPGQKRIQKMETPTYFSITEQKGDMEEDGSYKRNDGRVYIRDRTGDKDNTTSVHELSHKSTNSLELLPIDTMVTLQERAVESINTMSFRSYAKHNLEFWEYLISPTELDARQNSARFWLFKNYKGYTADAVFEDTHYDFLQANHSRLPYDIQQLMDVFPDRKIFIDNMNKF